MHGARLSLIVVGIVAPGSAAFGTLVGMTSGWRGGVTGQVLMRIVDVQLTLPGILFALLLGSIFGPSLRNVIMMTLEVAIVIQVEAALSFLGVGVPAGTASWGRMITEGREVMIVVVPPLCLRHLPPQGGEKGRETASPPARGGERKGDGISPAGGEKGRETAFPPQGGKEERRHFSQLARGRERGWGRGCVRGKRTLQGCVYPVATMPSGLPLPLDGIRVTDFSWIVAGPQATRILADLGADVVKVENESYIDSMRIGLRQDPDKPSLNRSGFHSNLSRNKRGITANLFHDQGREAVERLLAVSDVVIENYSAGAFARMGFSWERLQEINPSLIYVSVSGFGHVGRDASYTTWGPSAQAISGATAMSGLADRPPAGWGFSYLDHSAGYYAAIAALMALHHRARTGEAQHVDMSQIECGMVVSAVPMLDYQVNGRSYERVGNRSRYPATAPHNTYPCSGDDRWIAIAVDDEVQWGALCEVLGLDELLRRFPLLRYGVAQGE